MNELLDLQKIMDSSADAFSPIYFSMAGCSGGENPPSGGSSGGSDIRTIAHL